MGCLCCATAGLRRPWRRRLRGGACLLPGSLRGQQRGRPGGLQRQRGDAGAYPAHRAAGRLPGTRLERSHHADHAGYVAMTFYNVFHLAVCAVCATPDRTAGRLPAIDMERGHHADHAGTRCTRGQPVSFTCCLNALVLARATLRLLLSCRLSQLPCRWPHFPRWPGAQQQCTSYWVCCAQWFLPLSCSGTTSSCKSYILMKIIRKITGNRRKSVSTAALEAEVGDQHLTYC